MGLQSHFIIDETSSQSGQEGSMAGLTSLDFDVAISELDVRATTLPITLTMQEQ